MSDNSNTIELRGGDDVAATPQTEVAVEATQTASVTTLGVEDAPEGKVESVKTPGVHVVAAGDVWNVKESGSSVVLFESATKKEATVWATDHARAVKAELFIHGKNGKIQSRNSYGNDPKGNG